MNIGELKHRITIEQCAKVSDVKAALLAHGQHSLAYGQKRHHKASVKGFIVVRINTHKVIHLQSDKTKQSQCLQHAIAIIYALCIVTSITELQVLADAMMI